MLGLNDLKETRFYRDAHQEGEQRFATLLLTRKFGELAPNLQEQIQQLSTPQLEALAVSVLAFNSIRDLENWLNDQ